LARHRDPARDKPTEPGHLGIDVLLVYYGHVVILHEL